jgi:thioredoxin reductase (NADPH)
MQKEDILKSGQHVTIYSTVWCPDCKRTKKFFGEQRVPYHNIDIEQDPEAMAFVEKVNQGKRIIPTIVCPDGTIMVEPSNAQLAEKLGLNTKAQRAFYDTIVIGAGPTGLTAALYMAREGLDTLVIERAGLGGQAGATEKMDNFPGFDEGIPGAEFADRLVRQARRFGVEILEAQEVTEITPDENYWIVKTGDGASYSCEALLLSTGARYRKLEVPGEDELIGTNVHFCATCDGAFYKGKRLLVVGVDIVEFLPTVKASQILRQKVSEQTNMQVTVNHAVKEFKIKNDRLQAVLVEDRLTGELKEWQYDGVFVFIGVSPNNDLVKEQVEVDHHGFVVTDKSLMTALPGLFAAGDVRAGSTKQAASAAGEGATAALMIRQYLKETA